MAVGLDDERVTTPDRLGESAVDLPVGKLGDVGFAEGLAQLVGDRLGQRAGSSTGYEVQLLVGDQFHG